MASQQKKSTPLKHPKGNSNFGTVTLADLVRHGKKPLSERERAEDPLDIFHRWNLPKDDDDAPAVKTRLAQTWRRWSDERKWLFLRTAETIADAERAKKAQNPQVRYDRHHRLYDMAIAAARLARELSISFPPPWERECKEIGDLVTRLVEFMDGVLFTTTANLERNVSAGVAGEMIKRFRQPTSKGTGQTNWELLRDLAWLASGKQYECSERTVRRYLECTPSGLVGQIEGNC